MTSNLHCPPAYAGSNVKDLVNLVLVEWREVQLVIDGDHESVVAFPQLVHVHDTRI